MNYGHWELLRARRTLMLSACLVFVPARPLLAQQGCTTGMRVEGTITDPTEPLSRAQRCKQMPENRA